MKQFRVKPGSKFKVKDVDPGHTTISKQKAAAENERIQQRLSELQEVLFAENRRKVLIILQGMDTSGKDGTIRHAMDSFNASSTRVVSFKKPTETELSRDYLWRVHANVPARGEVTIFNRSQYEDVLIVRVHEFVPKEVWSKRYDQINDFERLLAENDIVILKFFLHISRKEQAERLKERLDDPTKQWKFNRGDLDERKLWNDYMKAYEDAITKTSTDYAPWYIVPANKKWFRDWLVGSIIEKTLEKMDLQYPHPDLSGITIE